MDCASIPAPPLPDSPSLASTRPKLVVWSLETALRFASKPSLNGLLQYGLLYGSPPSLRFHYKSFITTTGKSARVECFGTQCLTGIARLTRSLSITPTRSHVPCKGLNHRPAMYMSEAGRPVLKSPSTLSRDWTATPVLTII